MFAFATSLIIVQFHFIKENGVGCQIFVANSGEKVQTLLVNSRNSSLLIVFFLPKSSLPIFSKTFCIIPVDLDK